MMQKKVCMLGTFSVGKTSLVSRYVRSIFSERYLTTIGVKIDKKVVATPRGQATLLIWDIYGDDEFQAVRASFLQGASGYFLVADGTRRSSLARLPALKSVMEDAVGKVPCRILLNKVDLQAEWELGTVEEQALAELGPVIKTSAKTGQGVEEAFVQLTTHMLGG